MGNLKIANRTKWLSLYLIFIGISILQPVYGQNEDQAILRVKINPTLGEAVNPRIGDGSSYIQTGIVTLDNLNNKYAVTGMERVFPYSPKYEARHKKHGLHLWYNLEVSGSFNDEEIISDFSNIGEVTNAELKRSPRLVYPQEPVVFSGSTTKSAASGLPFNDPMLDKQWHYHNRGQSGGTPGADIRLFEAWIKESGSSNIIVSVHDQGVDFEHEDLTDAKWVNEAELNGVAGVDDDENGYVDDIHGYSFSSDKGSIEPGYHGTHVAGTIAATNNNGIGVSGVAGGSGNGDGVKIMSCQILGGSVNNTPASFVYAADNGAVISQNSWGYQSPDFFEQVVIDAIDYFIEEAGNYPGSPMKGGVVIFAIGNEGVEGKYYPAAHEPCISVAAIGAQNIVAPYSNYGDWVDISAPGGNLGDDQVLTGEDNTYQNGILSTLNNNDYGFLDGTSMACPHVSGIAALIASKFQGPDFTKEDMLLHLLTAYNDSIYQIEYNKDFTDKLGSGAIDANLALATDNKIAPDQISDFTSNGIISQDFIVLEWTVPGDQDDGKALSYEIIYSEEEITLDNLGEATIRSFKNDSVEGDKITFELGGLTPSTEYNFAIRYIDRWGNKAAMSNVLTEKTNAGPVVMHLGDTVNIDIDVKKGNTIKKDSFIIVNQGEGLLRWDLDARHSEGIPYSVGPAKVFAPVTLETFSKRSGVLQSMPINGLEALNIERDHDEEYSGLVGSWPLIVLGESNTELPNSSATRFVVHNKEGFNLTHVDVFLRLEDKTEMPVLEVYKGAEINDAKLWLSQEINEVASGGMFTRILLKEQLYFEENTNFWVVVHVPPGNLYPLGAGLEASPEDSRNAYLSFNYGKTWSLIEDLTPDDQLVWAVYAMSRYKKLDEYITLAPEKGELQYGDTALIVATVDGAIMVDGNYRGNVVINTNEADRENFRIPVDINITGHDPIIQAPPRVDFGSVVIGWRRNQLFKLKNVGLSRLDVKDPFFEFSDPQFEYVQGINQEFDSGDEQDIYFSFTPQKPGLTIAYATLLDKNGDNQTFELIGVGLEPPLVEILPEENTFNYVTIGDTIKGDFVIKNNGKFTLDYFMPAFADGENMEYIPENFHKYGYRTSINESDKYQRPAFQWTDISGSGIDATQEIIKSSTKVREVPHVKIDFGFSFPFFGIPEDSVIITSYGLVTFDLHHHMWSQTPMTYYFERNTDRFISAWGGNTVLGVDEDCKIFYQKYSDKLVVQYNNANIGDPLSGDIFAKATFQIVLHENGDIYFYYKDAFETGLVDLTHYPEGTTMFDISTMIGIRDRILEDGVYIHDYKKRDFKYKSNSTIEFINPGYGLYFDISKTSGAVRSGETDTISYKIKTDSLNITTHKELLNIVTNDAKKILSPHTAIMEITKGADPIVSVSTDTLDFGNVFIGDNKSFPFQINNSGRAPEVITGIQTPANFSTDGLEFPYFLGPLKSTFVNVSIDTENLGEYKGELVITTQSDTSYTIFIHGKIIPAPEILVQPGSITEVILSGEQTDKTLKVSNPGDNELHFTMVGNEWLTVKGNKTQPEAMEARLPVFDYGVTKSTDEGGPAYEWIEIAETELGVYMDIDPYNNNFSEMIALPFTFNYYGIDYDSLIICANGFITFTEGQDKEDIQWSWGGPPIPNSSVPNNIIAPMWYGGGFDWKEIYPYTGVHYLIKEDHIIVEYKDCLNGFQMGYPMSFEVILYDNGKIKFQYKFSEEGPVFNMNYAVVGIENQDGTDGIEISYNSHVINSDMAILFTPAETYKLPAGGEMDMFVNLDARKLVQNGYQYNMPVPNNAPGGKELTVPVTLNVYGQPDIEVKDSIYFGPVQIVEGPGNKHIREFEIRNTGTAHFYIGKLQQAFPDVFKTEAYLETENMMTGDSEWLWMPLFEFSSTTSTQTPITVHAGQVLKLRTSIAPETSGIFDDGLVINTTIRNRNPDTIRFYAEAFMPPIVGVDTSYIEAFAISDNVVNSASFTLDNYKGGSDLIYTLDVEYIRKKDNSAALFTNNILQSAGLAPGLFSNRIEGRKRKKSAQVELFNRVLSYENAQMAETNLGFGGGYTFQAVTRFTAPDDGFNLSNVQVWYAPGELLNSNITVNVYGGSVLSPSNLVHSQVYNHSIETPDTEGQLVNIELNEAVLFFPGENFFVEIEYGKEQLFPQGLAPIENSIPNTFFFGNGAQYFDMAESDFSNYAWMIRAAELEFAGSTWLVLKGNEEGILPVGGDATIAFDLLAEYADDGLNTALIHIKSNDPITPDKVVEVNLNHNNGPQFTLDGTELTVLEKDTIQFEVSAYDIEEDDFEIFYSDLPGFVQAEKIENTIVVTCTPEYNDAGLYTLRFNGQDEHYNSSNMKVSLQVLNKNRAPEAVEMEDIVIGMDEEARIVYGGDLFFDPDNDAIDLRYVQTNESVFEVFVSGSDYLLKPLQLGESTLKFIATDKFGKTAENQLNILVTTENKIAGGMGWFEPYPNPTSDILNFSTQKVNTIRTIVRVSNMHGQTILVDEVQVTPDRKASINVGQLTSGVYFLTLDNCKYNCTHRFIKK